MCKLNKHGKTRIDPCMRKIVFILNNCCFKKNYKTVACCCGHGKYPPTLIVQGKDVAMDIFSGVWMKRKKRFYKRDKQGYYYIPETLEEK